MDDGVGDNLYIFKDIREEGMYMDFLPCQSDTSNLMEGSCMNSL